MLKSKIEMLKDELLKLNEYKTEKDIEGIEEIIENEDSKNEFYNYCKNLLYDCKVAKNTLTEKKKEIYEEREKILTNIIDIVCSI